MAKNLRGGTHTTLTETAALVVSVLESMSEVKRISPGIINQSSRRSGARRVTAIFTNAGLELSITGQGSQKVAVHTAPEDAPAVFKSLTLHKRLNNFSFDSRDRKPGI
jgi:hypothetical protein